MRVVKQALKLKYPECDIIDSVVSLRHLVYNDITNNAKAKHRLTNNLVGIKEYIQLFTQEIPLEFSDYSKYSIFLNEIANRLTTL